MVGKTYDDDSYQDPVKTSNDLSSLFGRLQDFPYARLRLEDCFNEWLALDGTKRVIAEVLDDTLLRSKQSSTHDVAASNQAALEKNNSVGGYSSAERVVVSTSLSASLSASSLQPPRYDSADCFGARVSRIVLFLLLYFIGPLQKQVRRKERKMK